MNNHTLISSDELSNEVRCTTCGFTGTTDEATNISCNDSIDISSGTIQGTAFGSSFPSYTVKLDDDDETALTSM